MVDRPQQPVLVLAAVIENLAALISRELDADAGEGTPIRDPQWAEALDRVVTGGRQALAILDDPQIRQALTGSPRQAERKTRQEDSERSVRFMARFGSQCPACGDGIEAGDDVAWSSGEVVHDTCAEEAGVEVYDRG
ncbi:hypothetical protein LWF15_13960 [Kineosporia rhizophila]|uniref:hypothetical protein n=1 Tax=Kineosporia rhizophila TaxID=84633 RepID=UPI001E2F5D46|nr:hypothetical protein [Kineosporia rhizophila]MCE0536613.1 hypothetical protein [Kineosporia rhizophila]